MDSSHSNVICHINNFVCYVLFFAHVEDSEISLQHVLLTFLLRLTVESNGEAKQNLTTVLSYQRDVGFIAFHAFCSDVSLNYLHLGIDSVICIFGNLEL